MRRLLMTLSEAEGHFCCCKPCSTHNSENIACFNYNVFIHKWKTHVGIVKDEGFLNVISSHIHWKSGNISETVLDRDVTTGHWREVILVYGPYLTATMTLCVLEAGFHTASFFMCDISYLWRVARTLCIHRASCWPREWSRQTDGRKDRQMDRSQHHLSYHRQGQLWLRSPRDVMLLLLEL